MEYLVEINHLGAPIQYSDRLTSIGIPIVEIRRSYHRFIYAMRFPILVIRHLYIESGPSVCVSVCVCVSSYQYRDPHVEDKNMGIPIPGKTVFLWDGAQVPSGSGSSSVPLFRFYPLCPSKVSANEKNFIYVTSSLIGWDTEYGLNIQAHIYLWVIPKWYDIWVKISLIA